jgi:hypothetical protein
MRFKMTPRMKAAIERHPRTQAELAALVGLHQTQVSLYLRGGAFGEQVKARVDELGALLRVVPATNHA